MRESKGGKKGEKNSGNDTRKGGREITMERQKEEEERGREKRVTLEDQDNFGSIRERKERRGEERKRRMIGTTRSKGREEEREGKRI